MDAGLAQEEVWDIDEEDLELEDEIGAGCFGSVYKGSYCGTPVAIKELYDASNAIIQKLVKREVATLKSMRHPNIVQFMGLCQNAQGIYIVTEFVPGGHLWARLKHPGVFLDWATRVQWAIDISQAMSYLHRKNFLHRDLKSKNLLVGDNNHIKICDFGFARTTQDQRSEMYMTKTGTGLWMAPEVTLGRPYSAKADVFSFGVILRELITRTKPPPRVPRDRFGFNPHEFRKGVPEDCPPALLQLAVDCVSYEPEHRPDFKTILIKLKLLKSELPPPVASPTPALTGMQTPGRVSAAGKAPPRVERAEHVPATSVAPPPVPLEEPSLLQKMQTFLSTLEEGDMSDGSDDDVILSDPSHSFLEDDTPPKIPALPPGLLHDAVASTSSQPPPVPAPLVHQETVQLASLFSQTQPAAASTPDSVAGLGPVSVPLVSCDSLEHFFLLNRSVKSLDPVLPLAITQRCRPEFEMLRGHLNSVFAANGAPRQMAKAVKVPPKEKKMPWLSVGIAHTFMWVVNCFNLVADECTDSACPTMMASPKIHYTWADGVKVCTPIECPAPQYVHYLFEWTREQLENPEILPLEGRIQRKVALPVYRVIAKKWFRVLAHIYFCHWSRIQRIGATSQFKFCFAFVLNLVAEFRLLDKKADATTLIPLQQLSREIRERCF